ncbi:MAG: hypothetical protein P8L77_03645 [Gammaproteobacteria bacterium]|nr:hypothetical protein [Gammaproteobacteria bacterium]
MNDGQPAVVVEGRLSFGNQSSDLSLEKIVSSLESIESFFNKDGANANITFLTNGEIQSFKEHYRKNNKKPWDNIDKETDSLRVMAYLRRMPLVPYICFNEQTKIQPESNDIQAIANNLYSSSIIFEANPKEALRFVKLSNELIYKTYTNRLKGWRKTFLDSEYYNRVTTYLIAFLGIISFGLTLFNIVSGMHATSLLVTLGIIGLILSEYIILKKVEKTDIDKAWPCLYMNSGIMVVAMIAMTILQTPMILTLSLVGTLTPLFAQHYHQKIVKDFINEQPKSSEDLKPVKDILDDELQQMVVDGKKKIKLNSMFEFNEANKTLEIIKETKSQK